MLKELMQSAVSISDERRMDLTTDWTEVWLNDSSLSLSEVTLSLVLLWLTALLEILSYLIHHSQDSKSLIDSRIVRTPVEEFSNVRQFGYNFKSNFVTITLSSRPGYPRVHYLDEGPRDAETVLLLLHGEPFWSFSWTKVIPALSTEARVIVPDLVGFGMSDKFVDWRLYDLDMHVETVARLLDHLNIAGSHQKVVFVGHNWGWMVGAGLARLRPELFSKLVILNTNNLPDGEVDTHRYSQTSTLTKFLVLNSFFLFFRASMNLVREHFPLSLLVHSLNKNYSSAMVAATLSPWPSPDYCGGTTAFPLMVPVTPSHPEAANMRRIRRFLSTWHRPTLVLYSDSSLLPWAQHGDFVVGRRMDFYTNLIPGVVRVRRLGGEVGHLVMWDDPHQVVQEIQHFLRY